MPSPRGVARPAMSPKHTRSGVPRPELVLAAWGCSLPVAHEELHADSTGAAAGETADQSEEADPFVDGAGLLRGRRS